MCRSADQSESRFQLPFRLLTAQRDHHLGE
jgi:hypothetical protein